MVHRYDGPDLGYAHPLFDRLQERLVLRRGNQVSGTGSVKLRKDGRLSGKFRIKNGDSSTFIAERAEEPDDPIPEPPSYRDKWTGWRPY